MEQINGTPKISIIMPSYNRKEYIEDAIDSILNQTFTDFELIIVDDFSSDGTYEFLEKLSGKDSRVRLFRNQKNLGIAGTLRHGLDKACGKYITRLDDDDLCPPYRLELQYRYLENHPDIDILSGQMKHIDENGEFINVEEHHTAFKHNIIWFSMFFGNSIVSAAAMAKSCVYKQFDKYGEEFGYSPIAEDYAFWLRIGGTVKFAALPENIYFYRRHTSNITKIALSIEEDRALKALHRGFEMFLNVKPHNDVLKTFWHGGVSVSSSAARKAILLISQLRITFYRKYDLTKKEKLFINNFSSSIIRKIFISNEKTLSTFITTLWSLLKISPKYLGKWFFKSLIYLINSL